MPDINWDACIAGSYSQYNARAKATLFKPADDGMIEATLWGGRRLLIGATPAFSLEYQGAIDSYIRDIDLLDVCTDRPWLFEAWYHFDKTLHTYAFHKVVSLTEIATGQSVTGDELRKLMNGAQLPKAD